MNKKLVILTGSFNPVTKAHYKILSDAVEYVKADKGLFVATSNEYLQNKIINKKKTKRPFILSEKTRSEMLSSLNKENEKLNFWGFEIGKESPSTYKTIKKIKKEHKDYDLYYLCGADKLESIPHWSNVEELFNELDIIVYSRGDIDLENIIHNSEFLTKNENKIHILTKNNEFNDISSTLLRNKFLSNEDYKDLMNDGPYQILKKYSPDDFKEITPEQLFESTIKYGGRFGGNAARLLVYKENVRVFKNWNVSLLGNREEKIKGTKVYKEEFKVNSNFSYNTEFDCQNVDCADMALTLLNEGLNPAILNLASNFHPCGGYHNGANAQEESLCYMSTLSQSLYQFGNPKLKYFKEANLVNIPDVYPLDVNFGGIYSPNVTFFRNNLDKFYSLREKPFSCGVITVASLSNRMKNEWTNDESIYFDDEGYLTEEGVNIEKNKIRTIYRIALINNHDSLVLGAFGCGVYNLKPDQVSKLFYEVLNEAEFKNQFKKVVFAIYEGKATRKKIVGKLGKFSSFYEIFGKESRNGK